MKRAFYILCFTLLGFLLQLIVHAIVESAVLALLLKDFDRYGLGLTWSQWYAVHHVATLALLIVGICLGFRWGVKWWQILYVEKRYGWPPTWKSRRSA
jgi:hypothetical protein